MLFSGCMFYFAHSEVRKYNIYGYDGDLIYLADNLLKKKKQL